ncbi:MAG TPA: hypothetical protein VF432_21720 [Thermoanaerobaculia bacterium]
METNSIRTTERQFPEAEGDVMAGAFTPEMLALPVTGHCCGPTHVAGDADIVWNDHAHRQLVERAAKLMEDPGVAGLPSVRLFNRLFWRNENYFKDQLFKGLLDADYKAPWFNPHLDKIAMYASHFCDPDTMSTLPYFKAVGWNGTAISEGPRYFNLAVETARRILRLGGEAPAEMFRTAGDYLGLALHFFTDLTQPMHAANFANVLGDGVIPNFLDFRHSHFEKYADKFIDGVKHPPLEAKPLTDAELAAIPDAASLYADLARHSKKIWNGGLYELTKKMGYGAAWDSRCDPFLKQAFEPAPARVALLFAYFAYCARQDVEVLGVRRGRWYKLIEPTRKDVLASQPENEYVRRQHDAPADRSTVAFLFNEEGRCAIVPRNNPKQTWSLLINVKTEYLRSLDGKAPGLRVLPVGDRSSRFYSGVRIRQNNGSGDYAVTVDDKSGYVYADNQNFGIAHPEAQLLRLSDEGPIAPEDLKRIAQARPGQRLDLPWWGTPEGEPQWRGTWSAPMTRPSGTVAAAAMASTGSGLLQSFAVIDGTLYRRDFAGFWEEWQKVEHPEAVTFAAPVAAVATGERLHVFASGTGAAGRLHHGSYAAGKWHWGSIEAPAGLKFLAACSTGPDRLDLLATNEAKRLLHRSFDGSTWGKWTDVTPAGIVYANPISAASFQPGRIDVTEVVDGTVRNTYNEGSVFKAWFLGAPPSFVPVRSLATSWDRDRLVVVALAQDGAVALRYWNGDWADWQIGKRSSGTIGNVVYAASWGPYRVDLIVTDHAGQLCHRAYC